MSYKVTLDKLKGDLPADQKAAVISALDACVDDPLGDGEQCLIPARDDPDLLATDGTLAETGMLRNEKTIPLRAARLSGLDMMGVLSEKMDGDPATMDFRVLCFLGLVRPVRLALATARRLRDAGNPTVMDTLLESRLSLLRLSPLHYACFGAYTVTKKTMTIYGAAGGDVRMTPRHELVVEELLYAGARVDSRDIAGYTPLSYAAGIKATPLSVKLVPMLVAGGADVNAKSRFGEVIITDAVLAQNEHGFQAMLDAGASLEIQDENGISVLSKTTFAPKLGQAWISSQRKKVMDMERCDYCEKTGARKFCSKCRKIYYCSKECQVKGWKGGHKLVCGKELPGMELMDIDIKTMLLPYVDEATGLPIELCSVTGMRTSKKLVPSNPGELFMVGVYTMMGADRRIPLVVISRKNRGFILLKHYGEGLERFKRLQSLVFEHGGTTRCIFVLARWLKPLDWKEGDDEDETEKKTHILRLDLTKFLPPPKDIW